MLQAEEFDGSSNPVLAVKGARVSNYGRCSISVMASTALKIDPYIPEAFRLRVWFDNYGAVASIPSQGKYISLSLQYYC